MFIKALYNIFFLSLKDALTFSLFVCEEVLLVFALLNPQCVLCFLRHYIIFFFLSLIGALFLVASPPPACFMKMFFLCGNVSQYGIKIIYLAFIQLELFLLQKNTLTNVRGLACRSDL